MFMPSQCEVNIDNKNLKGNGIEIKAIGQIIQIKILFYLKQLYVYLFLCTQSSMKNLMDYNLYVGGHETRSIIDFLCFTL